MSLAKWVLAKLLPARFELGKVNFCALEHPGLCVVRKKREKRAASDKLPAQFVFYSALYEVSCIVEKCECLYISVDLYPDTPLRAS